VEPLLPQSFTLSVGEHHRVGALTVTPLAIVEDSRCPKNVVCVWAGTVRTKVALERDGSQTTVMVGLGQPAAAAGAWLHLDAACPYRAHPEPRITAAEYRLSFTLSPGPEAANPPAPCGA
jgi:hypothetical protein